MDFSNYCMNCFQEKAVGGSCPHCGFSDGEDRREAYHLPKYCILSERYLIGRVVAFGGFGIIYKAWDTSLNICVAIKEFYPAGLVNRVPGTKELIMFAGDKKEQFNYQLSRFLDEARNMVKFKEHQFIVNAYNYFEENNTAYIVMEFLDGCSLGQYLESCGGKLDYNDTLAIMDPVMCALEALHEQHIIHRDISPSNIFITLSNRVKLIDFGAARFSTGEKETPMTIVLKPGYTPPEQYRAESRQGPWTDIYALGATIYKTMTGVMPEESIDRLVKDELKRPSELGIKMPGNAEKAIMTAMAIKEGIRFQKISEMRQAFGNKVDILFPEEEFNRRKKKRKVAAGSIIAAAVAVVAAAVVFFTSFSIKAEMIPAGTIEMWVPMSQVDSVSSEISNFKAAEQNQKFEIEVQGVPDEEYADKLAKALQSGDGPALFRADLLPEEQRDELCGNVGLYYLYFGSDSCAIKSRTSELKSSKQIPANFAVTVGYASRLQYARLGLDIPKQLGSAEDYPLNIETLTDKYGVTYGTLISPDNASEYYYTLFGNEYDGMCVSKYGSCLEAFSARDCVLYVGWSNEQPEIQAGKYMKNGYDIVPLAAENVEVKFTASYGVASGISLNEERLAMLVASYLSGVSIDGGLPASVDALKEYSSANSAFFGFIADDGAEYYKNLK